MSQHVVPQAVPGKIDWFYKRPTRWNQDRCGWNGGYSFDKPGFLLNGEPCMNDRQPGNVYGRCGTVRNACHQPKGIERGKGGEWYGQGRSIYRCGPPVGYGSEGGPPDGGYTAFGGTNPGVPPDRSGCAPAWAAFRADASANPPMGRAAAKATRTYHAVLCGLVEELGIPPGTPHGARLAKDAKICADEFVEFNDLAYLAGAPYITPIIPTVHYGPRQIPRTPAPPFQVLPRDPNVPAEANNSGPARRSRLAQ